VECILTVGREILEFSFCFVWLSYLVGMGIGVVEVIPGSTRLGTRIDMA
jgi:hypothetical protein